MPEGSVGARGIGPRGGERWDEAAVGLGQICMVNVDRIAAQPQGIDDGGDTGAVAGGSVKAVVMNARPSWFRALNNDRPAENLTWRF